MYRTEFWRTIASRVKSNEKGCTARDLGHQVRGSQKLWWQVAKLNSPRRPSLAPLP